MLESKSQPNQINQQNSLVRSNYSQVSKIPAVASVQREESKGLVNPVKNPMQWDEGLDDLISPTKYTTFQNPNKVQISTN